MGAICENCHPEVDDEEDAYVAWEDTSRPLLKRWWRSFWSVEVIPSRGSLRAPLLFVLMSQVMIWTTVALALLVLDAAKGRESLVPTLIIVAVALPVLLLLTTISLVAWAGVVHAMVRLAGGVGDFRATWRCCAYSMSLYFLPGTSWWARALMASGMLLLSTGHLSRSHRISWGRTVLAGLLPVIVLMAPALLKPLLGFATAKLRDAGYIELAPTMPRSLSDRSLTADQRRTLREMRALAANGQELIRSLFANPNPALFATTRDAIFSACDRAAEALPDSPEPDYWRARTARLCGEDGAALTAVKRAPKSEQPYPPATLELVLLDADLLRSSRRGRLDAAFRALVMSRARDAADGLDGAPSAPPVLADLPPPAAETRRLSRLAVVAGALQTTGVGEADRLLARAIASWANGDEAGTRAALGPAAGVEAVEILATLDLEKGDYRSALNRLDEAVARFPGHGGLRKLLSLARMAEGLRASDPALLRQAVADAEPASPPLTHASHLPRRAAMARLCLGNWPKVIADLEHEKGETHAIIRGCALLLARDAGAETLFDRLLADPSDAAEIRLLRGDARAARGAWADAISDYDAAPDGRRSRAWALGKWTATDPSKAPEAAEAWAPFRDPVACVRRGDALLALSPPAAVAALDCFEQAIRACPSFFDRLQPRITKARSLLK
jgi:tetratricopeptide (TPR) repeat protein